MNNIMKLADAYAEASFDQGLDRTENDTKPEEARAALEAAVNQQAAEIERLRQKCDHSMSVVNRLTVERDALQSEIERLKASEPQAKNDACEVLATALHFIPASEPDLLRDVTRLCHDLRTYGKPQASEPQAQADRKSWLIEITAGAIAPAWLCGPDMRIGWTKNANAAISFPSNEVAEEVFARLMDKPRWRSLGFDKSCYAITEHLFVDAHPQSSEPVWRDIATAPKDGTAILGCWPSYIGGEAIITGCQYVGRSWVTVDYMHLEIAEPIYWMPLPAAPEATK